MQRPLLAAVAVTGLAFAGPSSPPPRPKSVPAAPAALPPAQAEASGAHWVEAARAALDRAAKVKVPFAAPEELELGDAQAVAFAFDAFGGQTLELTLARDAPPEAEVYVEVFRVVDVLGQALRHRLGALRPGATTLRKTLPRDGVYEVLVQAGGSGAGRYRLTLELGAALPFPVVGADASAIRSLFGAPRDDGLRRHEGIDIYARRLTPVLAVAPGRAMVRQDRLGGNTVWLNTPGTSYYYAHLDRVAVRDGQPVKPGDVLGYVGNTGNADVTPPHLHFGVYRWAREPIDPLPLVVGQRFGLPPPDGPAAAHGG